MSKIGLTVPLLSKAVNIIKKEFGGPVSNFKDKEIHEIYSYYETENYIFWLYYFHPKSCFEFYHSLSAYYLEVVKKNKVARKFVPVPSTVYFW